MLRRESHGSRKLEKSSVWGRGEGGVTGGGGGGGGRVSRHRARVALFLFPKFNSATAAQRKCPERRRSRPIGAGLGDVKERAELADGPGAEGEGGPGASE